MTEFEKKLAALINECSMENGSNTPDFLLAKYLVGCLVNYNAAIMARESWYGRTPETFTAPNRSVGGMARMSTAGEVPADSPLRMCMASVELERVGVHNCVHSALPGSEFCVIHQGFGK